MQILPEIRESCRRAARDLGRITVKNLKNTATSLRGGIGGKLRSSGDAPCKESAGYDASYVKIVSLAGFPLRPYSA